MTKSSENIVQGKSAKRSQNASQLQKVKTHKPPTDIGKKQIKVELTKDIKKILDIGGNSRNKRAYLDKVHNSHHLAIPAKVKEVRQYRKHTREENQLENSTRLIMEPSEEVYGPQTEDELECTRQGTANFPEGIYSPQVQQTWRPMNQDDRESEINFHDTPMIPNNRSEPAMKVIKVNDHIKEFSTSRQPAWFQDSERAYETFTSSPNQKSNISNDVMMTNEKEKSMTTLWMSGSRLHLPVNPLLEARDKIKSILEVTNSKQAYGSPSTSKLGIHRMESYSDFRNRSDVRLSKCQSTRGKLKLDLNRMSEKYYDTSSRSSCRPSGLSGSRTVFDRSDKSRRKLFDRRPEIQALVKHSMEKSEIIKILKLHRQLQSRVSTLADKFKSDKS